jgi:hypothetical protein
MSILHRREFVAKNTFLLGAFLLFMALFFTLIVTSSNVSAAPGKINYQGRLTDATGAAKPDGQYNMKFRIYDAASGGTLLWSETRETTNRVTVTNGQFSVQLGAVTPITDSVFSANSTYFEVELPTPATATCSTASCGTYTEGAMTPRQPVSSAAYAMQANNASTLDGIDSTSLARNDATNIFASNNTFNGTVTVGSANSATKFVINDNSSVALFTADTSATIVKVGTTSAATLTNVRLLTTSAEFTGTVRIGTATDGVDISGANGILLSGTARRTDSMILTPEYANSVLDAGSGSNNTGSMTTKLDLSTRRNYYKWTTSQGAAQSYDVIVQVPIPRDFSAWASTTPITVDTYTTDTTNGTITIQALDTGGTIVSGMNFSSITPTATTAWQSRSPGTISGTFTPGGLMLLRIRMASPTSGDVRISTIKMDYLTKW